MSRHFHHFNDNKSNDNTSDFRKILEELRILKIIVFLKLFLL